MPTARLAGFIFANGIKFFILFEPISRPPIEFYPLLMFVRPFLFLDRNAHVIFFQPDSEATPSGTLYDASRVVAQ